MQFKRGDFCMCIGGAYQSVYGHTFTLTSLVQDDIGTPEPGWRTDPDQWDGDSIVCFDERHLMLIRRPGTPPTTEVDREPAEDFAHG